jgi:hypothetical protein
MKRTFWATAVFVTFMAGAACSDSSGPKLPAEVGTYTLATVNSGGLPAVVFQNSAGRIVILGATMLLREDKSYLETRNYNTVLTTGESSPTTITENGTYGVVGTQITFTIPASGSNAALSYTGAVSDGKLTYTYSGISYQYQK